MQYQCDHYTKIRFRAGSTEIARLLQQKKTNYADCDKQKKVLSTDCTLYQKKDGGPLIQTKLWKRRHFTLCLLTHSSRITCSVASSQAAIPSSASDYQ